MDETASRPCPIADFCIGRVAPSGSATTVALFLCKVSHIKSLVGSIPCSSTHYVVLQL
jgi:hypothetical protein